MRTCANLPNVMRLGRGQSDNIKYCNGHLRCLTFADVAGWFGEAWLDKNEDVVCAFQREDFGQTTTSATTFKAHRSQLVSIIITCRRQLPAVESSCRTFRRTKITSLTVIIINYWRWRI